MLVTCPKCHFKQPKDQYCANCGVDMLSLSPNYTPPSEQLKSKSKTNHFVPLFLSVSVAFAVAYTLIQSNPSQKWIRKMNLFQAVKVSGDESKKRTLTRASSSLNESSTEPLSDTLDSEANSLNQENVQNNLNSDDVANATLKATANEALGSSSPSSNPTLQSTGGASSSTQGLKESRNALIEKTTVIEIAEINYETIDNLINLMQSQNSLYIDQDIKVGTLSDYKNIQLNSKKEILSEKIKIPKNDFSFLWFGNKTPLESEKMGLYLSFELSNENVVKESTDGPSEILKLIIQKVHPASGFRIPLNVPLKKNETLIIAGPSLLNDFEFETSLSQVKPFTIFKSLDYKSQKTTIAIIIHSYE